MRISVEALRVRAANFEALGSHPLTSASIYLPQSLKSDPFLDYCVFFYPASFFPTIHRFPHLCLGSSYGLPDSFTGDSHAFASIRAHPKCVTGTVLTFYRGKSRWP